MNREEIMNILIRIMKEVGIIIELKQTESGQYQDIDLKEHILDSFQFISFVIEVEKQFNISLPEQFLVVDNFSSIYAITESIMELICE